MMTITIYEIRTPMTITDAIKFMVAMIIMMNPLGSMSIYLDLTHKETYREQRKVVFHTSIAITIIMLLSIWSGRGFLDILGISIPAFRFAGGIILLLMGLSMLQSRESAVSHTTEDDEAAKDRHSIAIVPLALPVIIGPGAISTLVIASGDFPSLSYKLLLSFICILLALGMAIMMYFAAPIARFVGTSIMKAVTRIMGMIIMAIAVGMLADGLTGLIPTLR